MFRDQNPVDSSSTPSTAKKRAAKPLLVVDDATQHAGEAVDAHEFSGVPAADSQGDGFGLPSQDRNRSMAARETRRGLSPSQRRRKQQAQKLLVATILTGILITTVIWSRRRAEQNHPTAEVPTIVPSLLFEQRCQQIRERQDETLHVTEFAVDDAMVRSMAGLDSLETVIFDQGAVTDQAIETIASLPKLRHLRLRLSPIGDEGLSRIASIESLWYLNLPHAECTSQGIAELAALPRLRQLRLGSGKLGNEVAREIAKITSLRGIHLIGIPVTDEGLKSLAAMKHLESLYLDDCAVTEAGWEWLFQEHPYLHVHINQSHHDRDPKAHPHH
jgi:hypothetical protein